MAHSFDAINAALYSTPATAPRQETPLPKNMQILPEYHRVCSLLEDPATPLVFVTGGAGTGKSTLIRYLVSQTDRFGHLPVVAPTGIAALNVSGQTIHKFFKIPVIADNEIYTSQALANVLQKQHDWRMLSRITTIIIDEASMLRADLLDAIDHVLKTATGKSNLFGGIKLLLVGDLLQLPPVCKNGAKEQLHNRNYRDKYFFNAKCLQGNQFESVTLTRPFRQTSQDFLALLNNIRTGTNLTETVNAINSAAAATVTAPCSLTVTPRRATADTINLQNLQALPGTELIFSAVIEGRFSYNYQTNGTPDDAKLPAPFHLKLKKDAMVMFTKNDLAERWVNGTIGKVKGTEKRDDGVTILVEAPPGSGNIYTVQQEKWEDYKYEYDQDKDEVKKTSKGAYIQYPLQLAWAVTIHKCQGLTLEAITIDLGDGGAFEEGQTYVALSRCTSREGITLKHPIRTTDIKTNQRLLDFYKNIATEK